MKRKRQIFLHPWLETNEYDKDNVIRRHAETNLYQECAWRYDEDFIYPFQGFFVEIFRIWKVRPTSFVDAFVMSVLVRATIFS